MGYAPDVLIVPSRLKHFSKVTSATLVPLAIQLKGLFQIVDNTLAINPSFLTKAIFASLSYTGHGDGPTKSRIKVDVGRMPDP